MTSASIRLVEIKYTLASLRDMNLEFSSERPEKRRYRTNSWEQIADDVDSDELRQRLLNRSGENRGGRQVCQLEQGLLSVVLLAAKSGDEIYGFTER
jgi:hypothetical protein